MAQAKRTAAWTAAAVACVASFEGLRTTAYRDPAPAGTLTICFGETRGVKAGDTKTPQECRDMLEARLWDFYASAKKCIPTLGTMPPTRIASIVSLNYNIGPSNLCRSSVARLLNAGHVAEGCDAFLKFNRAGGVVFKGLTRRREEERRLCLA